MHRRISIAAVAAVTFSVVVALTAPTTVHAGWRGKKVRSTKSPSLNSNYYYTSPIWARPGSMVAKSKR